MIVPDVALQHTQSLSQLGVGLAIALLYFVEYQVRICNQLAEALEAFKPQLDKLTTFDAYRYQQAQESSIAAMNKERRNQSIRQHEEVELLKAVINKVNSRMWSHIYSLRHSSKRLSYACLLTGIISFTFLLLSTAFPDRKISVFPVLCASILFAAALFYLLYKIVQESWTVQRACRRRHLKESGLPSEDRNLALKGLHSIDQGDEPGVVYYLQRQLNSRVEQTKAYDFSRYTQA